MKNVKNKVEHNDDIDNYTNAQITTFAKICSVLHKEIDSALPNATSRIYYSMPVWFICDNPIVSYNVKPKYVNLMFWNGQSFNETDLIPAGKYKAAQIKFTNVNEINLRSLRKWLKKSKTQIWNYNEIRIKDKI